ncbi:aldose epimerase family protein [Tropicimonas sp. IMCC34043]|uniref:aldose epimerase family protein n=1 Tax=Tropicimonas sp. IMCC34043 TaxID=2248760 RepID=UPI000E269D40|nr:aldose epimerase family protein [Tropicimonas sp. IMCC34043]
MRKESFGTTRDARTVERITLDNGTLSIGLLTLGATLQELRLAGCDRSLTLGSADVAEYDTDGGLYYFGAIVGPVANRILNATTSLDGRTLTLQANGPGGHCLHGGLNGLHQKVWEIVDATDTEVTLATTAADGEGGFPGNRRFEARFTLDGASLVLTLRAETDAPTLVNLANHSYWNLGPGPDFHDHSLQVSADRMLVVDDVAMVTGEILPVAGTAFDFREPRQLTPEDDIDNNFCLAEARGPLRPGCVLTGPDGLRMEVATTEPGLQIYDARHMPAAGVPGHDGHRYGPRSGVAIEAQFWPDSPNHPEFPSIRLDPGQPWEQVTRFTFSRG